MPAMPKLVGHIEACTLGDGTWRSHVVSSFHVPESERLSITVRIQW